MPGGIKSLVQAPKPDIVITLHQKRQTFGTRDRIEGVVAITAPIDTSFDDVEIDFIGTSRTFVERMTPAAAVSGRSEALHHFLKMSQPSLAALYPENQVLVAGETYHFPFLFVVPLQLLPRICQHGVQSPAVRDAHLLLPPSFGDKELGGEGPLDDMAPEMASVRYGIFAKLSHQKWSGGEWRKTSVGVKAANLRIVPATDEQPPLSVDEHSDYTLRREKALKKGLLKGKLGTLVMEAAQPKSLRLPSLHCAEACSPTTMTTVMVRFDPADESSPPPRLGSMSSKLKVVNFFASQARPSFPAKTAAFLDPSQGVHSEQITLSSRCMASVEWSKHRADERKPSSTSQTTQRRDSAMSMSSLDTGVTPAPSAHYKGQSYYVARLLVPITLPASKSFPPTFHSCLISRVYALNLHLGLHTAGIGASMELKVPVQISTDADLPVHRRSLPTVSEEALDSSEHDVGAFFAPRPIRQPPEHFVGRSSVVVAAPQPAPQPASQSTPAPASAADDAPPPSYSFFAPGSQQRAQRVPVY